MLVILNMNPEESGLMALVLFYLTLLMGLIGLFTCFGSSYRVFFRKRHDVIRREVRTSFRHSVFLAFLGVLALLLSAQGILTWWACLLLLAGGGMIEYLFLMREEVRRS